MTIDPDNPLGLSATLLAQVDKICVAFERAWRSGAQPNIADFVAQAGDPESRSSLLHELLLLDIDYRRRQGEAPDVSEYASAFPHDSDVIETVFAAGDDTDNAAESLAAPLRDMTNVSVPDVLGRYRIIERVGEGGFGTVYRARDDHLQRDVAIKAPHRLLNRQAAIELFRDEARALATLRHPAIVPVYDVHFDENEPSSSFVVSEFMQSGDMAAYVGGKPLDPVEAATVVERIAAALHYAHGRGLVHRDVKLSNILRDADGQVYIADFGLALRDGAPAGEFAGTPATMSPEQAKGHGHLVDGRADVYGLGVVLYELLTGRRPFGDQDLSGLLEQIKHQDPKPPRQINDDIPIELESIALRALAKQPADRYTTALDMASDLARWKRHTAAPARGFGRSGWLALAVVAAAVAWLVLGLRRDAIPVDTVPAAGSIRTLAVLPFQLATVGDSSPYLGLGMADTLITSLSNLRDVVVRPTESVHDYLHKNADPVVAGQQLQVDAVLAGTIQQTAEQTQTVVRLIRVADGKSLWASTFDQPAADLFVVQDAIATQVAQALVMQLSATENKRLKRRHTNNRQAYEAYIRGRYHWNLRAEVGRSGLDDAIHHFKQAIDADPLYALAYTGLAESYALSNIYSSTLDEQAYPRARAAAKRALELDSELTEAHATMAQVLFYYDWDWQQAEKEFRRALQLNPNYATAHQWYAELLYFSRRFDEAIVQLKRAAELDPLSPVIRDLQATPYMWRRDYPRAQQELLKAQQLDPKSALVNYGLGVCYEQTSQLEQALECYQKQTFLPGQAYVLGKLGKHDQAREILAKLHARQPHKTPPYLIALVHLGLDEPAAALDWLEKGRAARDEHMVWLQVDPKLDPLRDTPRFQQLLRDVGWLK